MATPERGALPLHTQIAELLIRDVASGRLIDGEKLKPERDMAAGMGIAVGTLRKALHKLTAIGMLERVQGSGNFIRAKAKPIAVYSLFRLELLQGGGLPTARILEIARLKKDAALPSFGVAPEAHRIRRLRYLSGVPAALEEIWLDGTIVENIAVEDVSDSLYLYYRQSLGLWISRVEDSVGQGILPDWAPPEFPLAHGALLPMVTRVSFGQDGQSAEASLTWFDPGTTRYLARFS
ncbi:MAG: GntR family transcriptional regulator [bacterium]